MSTIKVSEEDLKELKELQYNFDVLTKRYGELKYQELLVEREMANIVELLGHYETTRSNKVKELQQRFGSTGQLDLETGVFTADK